VRIDPVAAPLTFRQEWFTLARPTSAAANMLSITPTLGTSVSVDIDVWVGFPAGWAAFALQ